MHGALTEPTLLEGEGDDAGRALSHQLLTLYLAFIGGGTRHVEFSAVPKNENRRWCEVQGQSEGAKGEKKIKAGVKNELGVGICF